MLHQAAGIFTICVQRSRSLTCAPTVPALLGIHACYGSGWHVVEGRVFDHLKLVLRDTVCFIRRREFYHVSAAGPVPHLRVNIPHDLGITPATVRDGTSWRVIFDHLKLVLRDTVCFIRRREFYHLSAAEPVPHLPAPTRENRACRGPDLRGNGVLSGIIACSGSG